MKNKFNIILGCLWIVIALFFGWLLFSKLNNGTNHLLFSSKVADSIFGDDGITLNIGDLSAGDLNTQYKGYTFNSTNVEDFDISLVSASVHFIQSHDSDIKVSLYGNWNSNIEPEVKCERKKIIVKSPNFKISKGTITGSRKVVIEIPASAASKLFNADISTVSGSIHSSDISFNELEVETTSGSIHLDGAASILTANTVSGSTNVNGSYENLKCNSVSGSIHVETDRPLTGKNSIDTVSGSIHLTIPEGSGFEFEWNTISGSVNNAFYNGKCGKSGSQIIGDGKARINAGTISGAIHLNKN